MSEQNRRSWKSRVLAGATAATFAVAGLASLGATPAEAAGKTTKGTQVETSRSDNCKSYGDRTAKRLGNGTCFLDDDADDTYFQVDSGGKAAKLEIFKGSTLVGKVEFHPAGEHLWVYDTANDHDTIYVQRDGGKEIYQPPQTSRKWDYKDFDLSGAEGKTYKYNVYDRKDGQKLSGFIGSLKGVA